MTTEELTALQALLAKMTPGEWVKSGRFTVNVLKPNHCLMNGGTLYVGAFNKNEADASGIVALVNAAPALLAGAARAAELEAEVARLKSVVYAATQAQTDHKSLLEETDEMPFIAAVKHFRGKTGFSLLEAKCAVERHRNTPGAQQ